MGVAGAAGKLERAVLATNSLCLSSDRLIDTFHCVCVMLSRCPVMAARWWREGRPAFTRAKERRAQLERQRITTSSSAPLPVAPTAQQVCLLYRQLLKEAETRLTVTDKRLFQRMVRREIEVTSRRTSARVQGIMYEKGLWVLQNRLGGLV